MEGLIEDLLPGGGGGGGGEMRELQLVNFSDILEVYKEKNRCIPL